MSIEASRTIFFSQIFFPSLRMSQGTSVSNFEFFLQGNKNLCVSEPSQKKQATFCSMRYAVERVNSHLTIVKKPKTESDEKR